ncbi:hypothetical protein LZC95_44715 [Pendulispora brunnea]|uniref:Uncharacterized protein n=1 Tax=Pendulispora brunnea TaxID=2905690 RepID=A0ABZ2K634_9BACT
MVHRFDRATVAALTCAMMAACSSVPELRFEQELADGGDASIDAPDAGHEGGSSTDGGIGNVCVDRNPPPGLPSCCGTVACGGEFCADGGSCDRCSDCKAGQLCCMGKNRGQTKCIAFGETCP